MGLFDRYRRKADPQETAARDRIRGWAMTILGDDPPVSLTISEIECGDPVCPGLETVILVMRDGEAMQAVKARKPMREVTQDDVAEALRYI